MPVASRWADWVPPASRPVHLEPISPINGLTPDAPCPHRGPIRDGDPWYCLACEAVSRLNQRRIDAVPAPAVTEPETLIARLAKEIAEGELPAHVADQFRDRIEDLQALIDVGFRPTSYQPDPHLKGGIG